MPGEHGSDFFMQFQQRNGLVGVARFIEIYARPKRTCSGRAGSFNA
jgi:hypothetical protein